LGSDAVIRGVLIRPGSNSIPGWAKVPGIKNETGGIMLSKTDFASRQSDWAPLARLNDQFSCLEHDAANFFDRLSVLLLLIIRLFRLARDLELLAF
jgi:hypothetical protein